MNLFTSTILATSLLLLPIACSKESKQQPETPSNLQPASGTETYPDTTPPGMEEHQQRPEESQPGMGPEHMEPGHQEPSTVPPPQDPNAPPSQDPSTSPEPGGIQKSGRSASPTQGTGGMGGGNGSGGSAGMGASRTR